MTSADWLVARKREVKRAVVFAREDGVCLTLEGPASFSIGDVIVTGEHGERWPVSRARFPERYRACEGTRAGEDGWYRSVPREVLARRLDARTEVRAGGGTLVGEAGDWLLDYRDGSRGVVRGDIFAETYEIVGTAPSR